VADEAMFSYLILDGDSEKSEHWGMMCPSGRAEGIFESAAMEGAARRVRNFVE
jgi:hypothetical protein